VYVCPALTERFLLTRHSTPCPPLAELRDEYSSLPEDAKTNGSAVLFVVLDRLVREKEPLLLSLGERLTARGQHCRHVAVVSQAAAAIRSRKDHHNQVMSAHLHGR